MEESFLFRTKKEYEQKIQHYISSQHYQEALYYLDTIENQVIDSIWLNFTRGQLYNALEQYHLSLPYFLKATQQVPESITLYSEIGWTYNRLEQFDEALFYLEKCVILGREDVWLYSELAYSYLKKGMQEEGIVYLLEGLALKPKDRWILEQLANAYSDLGNYVEANVMNKRLLEIEMDETLLQDIIILNEINETMEDQYFYLQQLQQYPDHHFFVMYHLGVYHNLKEEYEEATLVLEQIAENKRDGETWIELGYAYHQLEKIEDAIYAYKKGYDFYSDHLFLLSELAYLYGVINDDEQKLYYLDKAFECGRRDLWIYLNYIRVYLYSKNDLEKTFYYLTQANIIDSNDEELQFLWSEYEWMKNDGKKAQNRLLRILALRLDHALPPSFYEVQWNFEKTQLLTISNLERVYQFNEGLAYVETSQHGGFIDEQGNLIIDLNLAVDETKREDTYMFHDGYAIIQEEGESLYGMINQKGELVLETIYDDITFKKDHQRILLGPITILRFEDCHYVFKEEVGNYAEGLLPIKMGEDWYYCDLEKTVQIPQGFKEAQAFHHNKAIIKKENHYGVIDHQGNNILPFEYEDLMWANQHLIAKKNGHYGVISINGQVKIDFVWEALKDGYEGYYRVLNENGWGLLDAFGKIILPCCYDEVLPVFEGLIRVKKEGYYGMYDIHGKLIISLIYDTLTICKGQYIIAGVGYRYGYMDHLGHLLTPFMFQTATLPVNHIRCVSFQNQFYLVDDRKEKS